MGCEFHVRCDEVKISNISFVDNLFSMTAASQKSVRIIKYLLEEFNQMFGVKPILGRSKIFIPTIAV